jgi:hypothetical protein
MMEVFSKHKKTRFDKVSSINILLIVQNSLSIFWMEAQKMYRV